jgi:hypothetical protein
MRSPLPDLRVHRVQMVGDSVMLTVEIPIRLLLAWDAPGDEGVGPLAALWQGMLDALPEAQWREAARVHDLMFRLVEALPASYGEPFPPEVIEERIIEEGKPWVVARGALMCYFERLAREHPRRAKGIRRLLARLAPLDDLAVLLGMFGVVSAELAEIEEEERTARRGKDPRQR